jgi:hypothetical protein
MLQKQMGPMRWRRTGDASWASFECLQDGAATENLNDAAPGSAMGVEGETGRTRVSSKGR